jgi:hypothetical protein
MPIRFDCPHCKANYEVADDLGNKMIMCRVCKQRALVKTAGAATAASTVASVKKSGGVEISRRGFFAIGGLVLASIASIATGALLARKPWYTPPTADENGRPIRGPGFGGPGFGGPPPDWKGKDDKGGKGGKDDKAAPKGPV